MPNLETYLNEVQRRSDLVPQPLIRAWTSKEIDNVKRAIRIATANSGIIGAKIENFVGTNQAKGNKAADFLVQKLNAHLPHGGKISYAAGHGYPDRILHVNSQKICLEIKATSEWKDGDSNRRVLLSTPDKIIKLLNADAVDKPPAHLICTVIYERQLSIITTIRLDFINPKSKINIRLEASTSQRFLTQGSHEKFILPLKPL